MALSWKSEQLGQREEAESGSSLRSVQCSGEATEGVWQRLLRPASSSALRDTVAECGRCLLRGFRKETEVQSADSE